MSLPFGALSVPEMYERELVTPLFRPWAEAVIDDVELSAGDRLLDVACGTGIVARLARARLGETGSVVGVDASPAMLEVARRVGTGVDWREGDAAALPLRSGEQFDVVVCQQGFQFFADRAGAARQMHNALAPGGRVLVSTWRSDQESPLLAALRLVAERHLGPVADRRHSLADAGPVQEALRDAGFRDVRSSVSTRLIRFADGASFLRLNALALIGMSPASKAIDEQTRERMLEAIVADSAEPARAHTDERGLAYEIGANIVMALK